MNEQAKKNFQKLENQRKIYEIRKTENLKRIQKEAQAKQKSKNKGRVL